jgi:2-amino-4-hydroxy-6-hydroxymethyldihydropteridine diphosphokinase
MTAGRTHWWPAYVGIGSNLDDPRKQVRSAIEALADLPDSRLIRTSRLYRSPPMDGSEQPDYINAVVALLTQLDAFALLHALQGIEQRHGRRRVGQRWAARTLDLDLLVFGDRKICNDELTVPHPGIATRGFVLKPLCEIAPLLRIPGLSLATEVLHGLPASASVDAVPDE